MIIKDLSALGMALPVTLTIPQLAERWEHRLHVAAPANSVAQVRLARSSLIVRAKKLSQESGLSFDEVSKFLLEKTAKWAEAGKPLNAIIQSLPTNLKELGIMKMTEDFDEVQRLMGRAQ